jgi:Family of unknown function (DUF6084)
MAELSFECIGGRAERYSAMPTVVLTLRISETSGQRIDAIALRCQIRIEPNRRRYTDAEASRLQDLFGEPSRWADTLKPMQLATVQVMVPGFQGAAEVELPIMCGYDLEIASTKYFNALDGGQTPLLLLFSGTVFATREHKLSIQQVPWSKEAAYRLPASVWREAVDVHFPNSAYITLSRQTLDALQQFKSSRALPTWDSAVSALLAQAAERRP